MADNVSQIPPGRSQQLRQQLLRAADALEQSSSDTVRGSPSLDSRVLWNFGKKRKANFPRKCGPSKKKKLPTWTHTFVCIANVNEYTPPDGQQRADLQMAGLGEKRITLLADSDMGDIYSELTFHFPQLNDSGGFELLRIPEGSGKILQIISCPESGYTVSYLKAVVHNAKIYVRPLQKNLSLEPEKEEVVIDPPKEACLKCGNFIAVTGLREHIAGCGSDTESERKADEAVEENDVVEFEFVNDDHIITIDTPTGSPVNDDPVLEVALHLSKQEVSPEEADPQSMKDVVMTLKRSVDACEEFDMVIRRSNVLADSLRRMRKSNFTPTKKLNVLFVGEEGSDTGGLTREFFRLVGYTFSAKYLDSTGCFRHDAVSYQEGVYTKLGALFAMALVHGSGALPLLSPSVFNYVCGINASDIIVELEEVSDASVRNILEKIRDASDVEALRSLAADNIDLLLDCGFNKPIIKLQLSEKVDILQTVALQKVILTSLAELNDFRSGLGALGVDIALKKHGALLRPFFCNDVVSNLSSEYIRKMFSTVRFSEKGSNERIKEETAYTYFIDYLDDCERASGRKTREAEEQEGDDLVPSESSQDEGSGDVVSLPMILSFFTGADSIPPTGLHDAVLNFNATYTYPTASTCAIELTLPTKLANYDDFRRNLDIAFTMHGGFGLK